jgi:hypothetical protein
LEQNNKTIRTLLFALQGVGAVFVGVFLSAYLIGMFMTPSTTVLHSEPAFKIPLMIFGILFLVFVLFVVILAVLKKKK